MFLPVIPENCMSPAPPAAGSVPSVSVVDRSAALVTGTVLPAGLSGSRPTRESRLCTGCGLAAGADGGHR